jgi:hypothetical protein
MFNCKIEKYRFTVKNKETAVIVSDKMEIAEVVL